VEMLRVFALINTRFSTTSGKSKGTPQYPRAFAIFDDLFFPCGKTVKK